MKRLMPTGLISFLSTNPQMMVADLMEIIPSGFPPFYVTNGQWDITVPVGTAGFPLSNTTVFSANQWGRWQRGPITSEGMFDLNSNVMPLTLIPDAINGTAMPFLEVGILYGVSQGLFDQAQVTVWTAYMPTYNNVSYGLETKYLGYISALSELNRVSCEFDVSDPL
jgi:hypothetical protein